MPETPISPDAVYTARPTVRIDTQAYPMVSELIESMEMIESEGGLSSLELRLSNLASDARGEADYAFEDDRVLRLGAAIEIYTGDEAEPQEIFRGTITALEAEFDSRRPPELVVLAEDAFQKARMKRQSKVYDNAKIADIAREVASSAGLQPVIAGFTDDIGTQVQLNESDLAFLRRLLERYDGDLQVVGTELHVSPRGDVRRGTVELAMYSQLQSARVLADLSQQVTEINVPGWDITQGATFNATGRGVTPGPGQGRTGAQVLRDAIGGERPHLLSHLAAKDQTEAQAIADTAFDQRARRFVVIEGTAEGNPAIRVGTHVTISQLGPRFDNTYYVVRVCHRFDLQSGYRTEFEAECAYLGSG